MRDFFAGVPIDLEESAEIDGASKFRVFFTIALPLVALRPRRDVLLVLILAWNEYLLALFLSNANAQTMPVLVAAQNTTRGPQWWYMSVLIVDHDRAGHRHRRPSCRSTSRAGCSSARSRDRRAYARQPSQDVHKSFGAVGGRQGPRSRGRRRRVPRAARRIGLRQDDGAAHDRRPGDRRPPAQSTSAIAT